MSASANKISLIQHFQGHRIDEQLKKLASSNVKCPDDASMIIGGLIEADPSKNAKYLQWLVNQFIEHELLPEDFYKMNDLLTRFEDNKKHLEQKNIHCYNHRQLFDALEQYRKIESTVVVPAGQYKVLFDDPEEKFLAVELLDKEAALAFGKGTQWCTAHPEHNAFENYKEGLICVIYGERRWQLHYKSSQAMDENDRSLRDNKSDIDLLSGSKTYKKFIEYMIERYYTFLKDI
jgi:hypothetical protein